MKKIFNQCIDLFDKDFISREVKELHLNATVQKKNITFPTDRKLTEKAIVHCQRIPKKECVDLMHTNGLKIRKLKNELRFARKRRTCETSQKCLLKGAIR
jgi:hypothetical protein